MTRWPVFNVADMAVSGGMIILVAYLIFVGDPLNPPSKVPVENSDG
jgi:lipoprotein signal peptidase